MFEQQVLWHKLSKSFDSIKAYNNEEKWTNKRHKIIEDFKRQMLKVLEILLSSGFFLCSFY